MVRGREESLKVPGVEGSREGGLGWCGEDEASGVEGIGLSARYTRGRMAWGSGSMLSRLCRGSRDDARKAAMGP
jgi:hypothetical protein